MKTDIDELRQEYELKAMPHLMSGPEYLEYRRKTQSMEGKAVSLEPDEASTKPVVYPDSDGQPIAENTRQFDWIVTLVANLQVLFVNNPDVFVAGDLFWYPVEGDNRTRLAPDALVAFGRPKGHRGSYKQWEEGGVAPQVVFEVLAPGNTRKEMADKLAFYERYGVEEYYLYDPDNGRLQGWQRQAGRLVEIARMRGWVSPRLGVRFDLEGVDLCLTGPDGRRFASYVEMFQRAGQAAKRADQAAQQRARQDAQRAEEAAQWAAVAEAEVARLRALLKQQGIDYSG